MDCYKKKYEEQYQYVLDCMNPDGYENATPEEKVKRFVELFVDEYNTYETIKRYPSIKIRIAHYLMGLPSACSIDFETYGIAKIGLKWGYINEEVDPDTQSEFYLEKSCERFINNWWYIIADRIVEMVYYYDLVFPYECFA